jgi:hypothetical protein
MMPSACRRLWQLFALSLNFVQSFHSPLDEVISRVNEMTGTQALNPRSCLAALFLRIIIIMVFLARRRIIADDAVPASTSRLTSSHLQLTSHHSSVISHQESSVSNSISTIHSKSSTCTHFPHQEGLVYC